MSAIKRARLTVALVLLVSALYSFGATRQVLQLTNSVVETPTNFLSANAIATTNWVNARLATNALLVDLQSATNILLDDLESATNISTLKASYTNVADRILVNVYGTGYARTTNAGITTISITNSGSAGTNVVWPVAGTGLSTSTNGLAVTLSLSGAIPLANLGTNQPGTAGHVLATDGAGATYWTAQTGGGGGGTATWDTNTMILTLESITSLEWDTNTMILTATY